MTAIAGLLRLDGAPADQATLARMRDLLAPYGRDAQHMRIIGAAGFVRTLLRTTPEDAADAQPLEDADSGCVVLFDGRLDNRAELADALGLARAAIDGMADSALALRACLRWDTSAPARMDGDFALAMWQPRQGRLWLARSPLGRRPLFWYKQAAFFAFATMPKALLAIPGVPRAVCEKRLYSDLLLLPSAGPETLMRDVLRVEPGHILLLEGRDTRSWPFHRFDASRELRLSSDEEYVEAFREHLGRAVAVRLRASGRIASQLSSGFDSSTVTALAAARLAARGQGLLAYTSVPSAEFKGADSRSQHGDETVGATALSRRFSNVEHLLVRTHGLTACDVLDTEIARLDRAPQNPSNAVWIGAIAAHAAQSGARVMLTGQAGNLTISYNGNRLLAHLLGQGRLTTWLREMRAARRRGHGWKKLMVDSFGARIPDRAWNALRALRGHEAGFGYSPVHPRFLERMAPLSGTGPSVRRLDGRRARIVALHRTDPGEFNAAANCHGLELRDPTADVRLVEFLLSVPEDQYARDGQDRWLLRRAMAGILPPEITEARTKGLQAADWYEALSPTLPVMRTLLERARQSSTAGGCLDLDALEKSIVAWPARRHEAARQADIFHHKLLRGLAMAEFIRYLEGWEAADSASLQRQTAACPYLGSTSFTQIGSTW